VRFPPYVSGVRISQTDRSTSRNKREGKRGTSPTTGESVRKPKRRKTCRKASTGQKTSSMRSYRNIVSTQKQKIVLDLGARKKSTPFLNGKTSHRTPSRRPKKTYGRRHPVLVDWLDLRMVGPHPGLVALMFPNDTDVNLVTRSVVLPEKKLFVGLTDRQILLVARLRKVTVVLTS